MKRRRFMRLSHVIVLGGCLVDCSIAWEEQNVVNSREKAIDNSSGSRSSSRARQSGPTDIKSLSKILLQAGYPLTDAQVNYLLTLKPGPEFSQKMGDVLDENQLNAIKSGASSRGRRRR